MEKLQKISRLIVADAFFSKETFVNPLLKEGLQVISRLRNDAVLFYPTLQKPNGKRGHPKWYDGTVDFAKLDLSRCEEVEVDKGRLLGLKDVIDCYRTRSQLEFCFRDAKHYAGLKDCQSTDLRKLEFYRTIAMSSFSPPANDAIPLRFALLNACLAPCAGRAESVYHIIDGTGMETVRKCRFGNWHISETERLAARLAMKMYMHVRIVACIVSRNGTMASAQFVSDAVRPVLYDMDQPGGSE